jgi:hypothetical protein
LEVLELHVIQGQRKIERAGLCRVLDRKHWPVLLEFDVLVAVLLLQPILSGMLRKSQNRAKLVPLDIHLDGLTQVDQNGELSNWREALWVLLVAGRVRSVREPRQGGLPEGFRVIEVLVEVAFLGDGLGFHVSLVLNLFHSMSEGLELFFFVAKI